MATSLLACDKYAFLVSGSANARYLRDLENVYKTIKNYYGYPEDHIWVVLGNIEAGTPDASIIPPARLFSLSNPATIATDFDTYFTDFLNAAKVAPLPKASLAEPFRNSRVDINDKNTAFIYFTGIGTNDNADYQLVIGKDSTNTDVQIDGFWLINKLVLITDFSGNCHVEVIMQQDYSGGFDDNFFQSGILSDGSLTYACQKIQTTAGDTTNGSEFTSRWTKGLQMVPAISTAHSGKFADEISLTGDNTADFLISLERAKEFVTWYDNSTISGNPGYEHAASQNQYLGKPQFLIRDGDPVWISPDVYLEHPEPLQTNMQPYSESQYVVDVGTEINNWIHVVVRNHGTHPVRKFDVGAIVFLAGCNGSGNDDNITVNNSTIGGILCPVPCDDPVKPDDGTIKRSYNHKFVTIQFTNENHRCLRGIAKLSDGTVFDYQSWDLNTTDDRAQRNIDHWVANKSASGGTGTETETDDVKGTKKGIFRIENMFKFPRKFYLILPPELDHFSQMVKTRWSVIKKEKLIDTKPVERIKGRLKYLEFNLLPGKFVDISYEFRTTNKFKLDKPLELHFPIAIKGHWKTGKRWPKNFYTVSDMALIGGVSLVVQEGSADIVGKILLKGEKTPKPAQFIIHTQGKTQIAKIKALKDGSFEVRGIDPGIYRYYATDGTYTSPDKLLVLKNKDKKKVVIELTENVKAPVKRLKK